ncbi:MAG: hypothetical protein EON56_02675 [Alphaproteobacteria bacterium]|nr:MAG: hypothetical protein EON56_02675 [Alphaproteobacteria bacterium]
MNLIIRIDRGEVDGLVVIASCVSEADELKIAGSLSDDLGRALNCIYLSGDEVEKATKPLQPHKHFPVKDVL